MGDRCQALPAIPMNVPDPLRVALLATPEVLARLAKVVGGRSGPECMNLLGSFMQDQGQTLQPGIRIRFRNPGELDRETGSVGVPGGIRQLEFLWIPDK